MSGKDGEEVITLRKDRDMKAMITLQEGIRAMAETLNMVALNETINGFKRVDDLADKKAVERDAEQMAERIAVATEVLSLSLCIAFGLERSTARDLGIMAKVELVVPAIIKLQGQMSFKNAAAFKKEYPDGDALKNGYESLIDEACGKFGRLIAEKEALGCFTS